MQNQMLVKNFKKIVLAVLSFVLVMALVLFAVNNSKQETKQVQKMGVKVLDISNTSLENSKVQDGEIEEEIEGEESTEVSKVAGSNMKKANEKYETASSVYINKDNTVKLQLDGTDLVKYDKTTLTKDMIKVMVGTNEVTPTTKNLTGPFPLIDGRSGINFELELSGIPEDGVLSVIIPANTLYDAAGNPNEETQSTFDQEIIIDNTAPTSPVIVNSSNNEWTNQNITLNMSSTDTGSGFKKFQLKNSSSGNQWVDYRTTNPATDTWSAERNEMIYIRAVDNVGNISEEIPTNIKIDKTAPTFTSIEVKNLSTTGYDVYIYGVTDNNGSGVNRVLFPTWTDANDQDDIIWGIGTLQADGTTWVYRVNTADHNNEAGLYNTHIYLYDNLGNSRYAGSAGDSGVTVPTVTATFNSNGGTAANPGTIVKAYNNDLGTLPTTSRTGYDFSGWWTDATGGQQISTTTKMPASDVTYYAHWTAKSFTVTLDKNGGTGGTESVTATYDSLMPNITVPTRTGYTFKGYYSNTTAIDLVTAIQNANTTKRINFANAQSSANAWTMATAGDKNTHIQGKIIVTDSTLTTAPTLDCNDVSIIARSITRSGNDWIIYVDFDITENMVSKRGNIPYDATYRFIDVNNVNSGTTVTVEYLTKGGKKYYNNSGTGIYLSDFTAAGTIYAKWEVHKLTLRAHANGGLKSDGTVPSDPLYTYIYNYGDTLFSSSGVVDSLITSLRKTGYSNGNNWVANSPDSGLVFHTDKKFNTMQDFAEFCGKLNDFNNGDITIDIYVNWVPNTYTVTADANGGTIPTTSGWTGTGATATKQVTYDSPYGTLPTLTRKGYEFKGWNGKNLFNPEELITGTNIVSDANGNISASNKSSDPTGWNYASSNLKTTLSAGTYTLSFNFSTKSTSSYAEVRVYDDANNEIITKKLQNVDSESVTFTLNGTKNIGIKLKLYNGVTKIQLEKASSATPYEPYYLNATTPVTIEGNHTIKAIWEANKYKVTANVNSGTIGATSGWTGTGASATKQVEYESTYGNLPIPTRAGYAFEGWNISSNGSGTTYADSNREYKQLNYIEATGGQYINTGYKVGKNTGIEADFQFTDLAQQQRVYGNSYITNNAVLYDFYINSADSWAYAYNDTTGNWIHTGKKADINKHNLKFNVTSGKILIDDGATYNENISGSVNNTATYELRILMYNSKIKLYAFKIYENGTVVRNYVPAQRVSDNVVGMYETCTKTFLTNASGSGTFIAGTQGGVTSTTLVSAESDHNIYARWIANQYTLTLNPNGGTYNNKTTNSTINAQYGTEVNLGYPTKTGYTFKQWKTSDGTIYDKNLLTGALAPEFKAPSTNANAGWRIASNSEPSGGARSIIDITNPPVEGITKGFEIKSGNKYDVCQDSVPVTIGNTYTMSVWAKGTGKLNLQVGNSSYGVKLIDLNNVTEWTKYSYTFVAGTNGTANGNQTNIYFGNNTPNSGAIQICGMKLEENTGFSPLLWANITDTTTLVAEWELNTDKIIYNLDGGTNASGNPTSYTAESNTITINNPTRTGYTFAGWTDEQDKIGPVTGKNGSSMQTNITFNGSQITFTNTTSGNNYSNTKLQVWSGDCNTYLGEISSITSGSKSAEWTNTYDTGDYYLRFGTNGSTADASFFFKVRLEKNMTYKYGWILESFTSQKAVVNNLQFYRKGGSIVTIPNNIIPKGSSGNRTLTANWKVNQYTVTYKDVFVDSSNVAHGDPLGTTTKQKDYGSTVNATELGTDGSLNKYYSYYRYKGSSGNATVPANNDLVVYRYFWAWTDLNVYYANRSTQSGATVSFSSDGVNWVDRTNESQEEVIKPWGTTYYIKNIRPVNSTTEEFDSVSSNLTWDATNGYYKYTPTTAATSMNVYMKYKTFTITLNQNGGAGGTTAIYEKYNTGWYSNAAATTAITSITIPTRAGYTFGGYFNGTSTTTWIDSTGAIKLSANATSSNITLTAKWIANNYTLTFNANGGSVSTTTKSVTYGQTYTDLPTPTRPGYTFKGWYATFNGSNNYINLGRDYMYTNKISVHLSAYKDDWSSGNKKPISCTEGGGWNIENNAGKIQFANYDSGVGYKVATSNVTWASLASGWHDFDIIFDGTYTYGYLDGTKIATSVAYTSGKIGYYGNNSIFVGAEAGGSQTTPAGEYFTGYVGNVIIKNDSNLIAGTTYNTIVAPAQNLTLYAKWEANTYTVTYNGNGNTGGSTAQSTHTYDQEKALTTNGFTKTGYTFAGWSTSASDSSKIIDNAEYTGIKASGESGVNDFKSYIISAPFASGEVYQLDVDVKGSGSLTNYFYGAGGQGANGYLQVASTYSPTTGVTGTSYDGANNIPLTSEYKHYTVRFTLGSTGNVNNVKYLLFRAWAGTTATIKNVRFFKVSSSSISYVDGQTVKNLATSGNVNLYAIWQPNIYKITFDTQGATTSGHTVAYYLYNTVRDVTHGGTTYRNMYYYADAACTNPFSRTAITPPTKTGYVFGGYFTGTNGAGTQYIDSSGGFINNVYKTVGDKTLYAYWHKTITLTQKHGTSTTTQSYTLQTGETSHTFTLETSKDSFDGWTFEGWLNNPTPKAPDYGKTATITLSADKTVYATYSRVYTATFKDYNGTTARTRTVTGTAYGNNGCGGVSNQYPTITSPAVGTYTGWTTVGWRADTTAASTATVASGGQITGLSSNPTYYAVYSKGVTATLKTYNNQSTTKNGTVYYNSYGNTANASIALGTTGNITKDSVTYTPRHWSTSDAADASSSVALNGSASINVNTTYYASYYKTYTATFYYLSGTTKTYKTATANRLVNYTGTIIEGSYTVPSEAKADTDKFTYSKITTQTTYNGASVTPTTPTTTFYTIYKRTAAVKVSYNANGGSGTTASSTWGNQYVNASGDVQSKDIELRNCGFKKDKYVFTKWALGSASGTQYAAGTTFTLKPLIQDSGEYTFYAVWADANYVMVKDYRAQVYANSTSYYDGTKVGYYLTLGDAVTAFNGMSKTSSSTVAIAALRDCTDNSEVTITNTTCELEICSSDRNVFSAGTGTNYEITRGKTINIGTGAKVLFRGGGKFSSTTSHIIDMTGGEVRIQNGQFKTTYQDTITLTGGKLTTGPDITGYYPIIYTTDGSAIRNDGGTVNIISGQICHGDFGNDYTSSSWPAINNYSGSVNIGDGGIAGMKKILVIGKGSDAIINRGELTILHRSAQLEIVSWGKTGIWQPSSATNAETWIGYNAKVVGDTHGIAIDGGYCNLGKEGEGYVIQSKGSTSHYAVKNSTSNKIVMNNPGRLISYNKNHAFSNYSNVEYYNDLHATETAGTYDSEAVMITTISQ